MKNKKYLITFIVILFLSGCTDERIIDLPLEDMSGKIVIEGNVTDKNGPYTVRITRSSKITGSTNSQPVTNATVVISDNHSQSDILKYDTGIRAYKTVNLTTHYGDIYTLSVTIDGTIYKAVSKMPEYVEFTDLKQKDISSGDYIERHVIPIFTDPATEGNYYLFKSNNYAIDATLSYGKEFTLFSDYIGNGQVNGKRLNGYGFVKNSKVKVEMQCVDEAVYNYFKALPQVTVNNSGGDVTPVNPPSNISNGALGYFSAHTTAEKEIIIQ